jgi:hypothetical protein
MTDSKEIKQAEITGGCMCGEVRYLLTCEPIFTAMCHCSDCRRSCGAQCVAWVVVPVEHFSYTAGEPARFASSEDVERTFCSTCGTTLTYQIKKRKNHMDITTGSLDDPEAYPPTLDYHSRDRLSWVKNYTEKQNE